MKTEPNFDTAQLAHVEIFSPKPEESLHFFKNYLGMEESYRQGQSVYLRAYEDFYHHSLKITEAKEPGMGHTAWRASSEQALERRVNAIKQSGYGQGWSEGDYGHGPAYQFLTPDGHNMEILWEVDYYQAPEDKWTPLLNRPQKRPTRGVPVRRIDHVNLLASDVTKNKEFMMDQLGFKLREHIALNNGQDGAAWLSVSPLVHEVAFMGDQAGGKGRLHHICYWYGYPQHLSDISDLLTENGYQIEAGPGKHGVSQANFLYVFEPGGNRVELFGDSGYLIFDPDWKPISWKEEEIEKGIIWYGAPLPSEYFKYGTPVIDKKIPSKS
ncbi:catechol 2,3-dioxygenase [Alkalihalobacillus sp. MEB130]|uniref:catechol 2,3-dioxygenase n=1 Tax=Alkalihalobacillus sp. MEB130 TaxID=2976704 RepID=UPI0028DEDAEE|nr:catechol 2,3-dioxygenase [Alkalihalobacillus sp. MEB130]MDT8860737.1 catechol 2,3-dioxygenase [Alkalihalobacillus sp. MEB130]